MDLERVAAVLRPRGRWEAVDLGVALLQSWARPVASAWAVTVLPVSLAVLIALRGSPGRTAAAVVVLWWLRPLFERVPLWVLSRRLFGATADLQALVRELPRLWLRRIPLALLAHRWHYARAMVQPVALLEGSSGRPRARREALLTRDGGGVAFLVGLTSLLFELSLFLSLVLLVWMFTPGELLPDFEPLDRGDFAGFEPGWFGWALRLAWLASYSITGPLHASAGFALYLNRRMHLEGWDVVLVFRRLAARFARTGGRAAGAVLVALALFGTPPLARAQEPVGAERDPQAVIDELIGREEFRQSEIRGHLSFGERNELQRPSLEWLAVLFEVALWIGLAAVVVALIVLISRRAGWLRWKREEGPPAPETPTHLFGLDLRPESLPRDVAAEALELWKRGEAVAALGLLYRAAISRLISAEGLQLEKSDTESDCLRRARRIADAELAGYFAAITEAWLTCAYSAALPPDERVAELCRDWPAHFERRAA